MTPSRNGVAAAAVLFLAGWVLPVPAAAGPSATAGIFARRGEDDGAEGRRGRHRGGRRDAEAGPGVISADPQAKELFEAKCSICHSLSRPLRKSRERTWWAETVTRMQRVNGCPISDEEARTIIDYLAVVRGPDAPRGPDDDEGRDRGTGPPGPPVVGGNPEARTLFEKKCSLCHSVDRPLGKTKDKAGWTATVTRMQKVNGCPLTDEEALAIIEYLATIRAPAGN